MHRISTNDLPMDEAAAALVGECIAYDHAAIAAGLAKGATRRRMASYARQHMRNAIALADRVHGAPSSDALNMSDAELLAELEA